jgi:hypothetical protein
MNFRNKDLLTKKFYEYISTKERYCFITEEDYAKRLAKEKEIEIKR